VAKHGKKFTQATAKVELRPYSLHDALELAKAASFVKFDETVEIALRLGVDPNTPTRWCAARWSLPHGLGKTPASSSFASRRKIREAREAGADFVAANDMAKKIEGGWLDHRAAHHLVGVLGVLHLSAARSPPSRRT